MLSLAFQDTTLRVECGGADRVADWSWRELADGFPGSLFSLPSANTFGCFASTWRRKMR
jgi:hypothetical protein